LVRLIGKFKDRTDVLREVRQAMIATLENQVLGAGIAREHLTPIE
jgi:hypothetical protein